MTSNLFDSIVTSLSKPKSQYQDIHNASNFEYIGSTIVVCGSFTDTTYNFAIHNDNKKQRDGFSQFYNHLRTIVLLHQSTTTDSVTTVEHALLQKKTVDLLIECCKTSIPKLKDINLEKHFDNNLIQHYYIVSLVKQHWLKSSSGKVDPLDTFKEYKYMHGLFTIHIVKSEGLFAGEYVVHRRLEIRNIKN